MSSIKWKILPILSKIMRAYFEKKKKKPQFTTPWELGFHISHMGFYFPWNMEILFPWECYFPISLFWKLQPNMRPFSIFPLTTLSPLLFPWTKWVLRLPWDKTIAYGDICIHIPHAPQTKLLKKGVIPCIKLRHIYYTWNRCSYRHYNHNPRQLLISKIELQIMTNFNKQKEKQALVDFYRSSQTGYCHFHLS